MVKRPKVSTIGIVLTFLFGLFAVYTGLIYEKKPQIKIDVITNTEILDVRENLSDLKIMFMGSDLTAIKKNIRIITVKFINNGNADIIKSLFDENDLFGYKISNGTIISSPELLTASNDYLQRNIEIVLSDSQTIRFKPLIIEQDQSFIIKTLVMCDFNVLPTISVVGIISGTTGKITFSNTYLADKESFISITFRGNIFVQFVRAIVYSVIAILMLLLFALIFESLKDKMEIRKRRRIVINYCKKNKIVDVGKCLSLFEPYIEDGGHGVLLMKNLTLVVDLKKLFVLLQDSTKDSEKGHLWLNIYDDEDLLEEINRYIEEGIIKTDEKKMYIADLYKSNISDFINYLLKYKYINFDWYMKSKQKYSFNI